ncbi:hypothetical protein KXD40_001578 [Peronospora effusa]|uniref:HSF-type DNA-binding domain-containing protein n=2 Tax=Peronospora TaxID=70742 RepID=A0A3M6VGB5_9STRA|nr:hypothetical protein DD238_007715 [Peronospora effusa]CAH0487500.1 unnamed protein product [Peronospora farinosa]RQM16211.1 hypothetical protein DD237_003024 [Peronospora effusa]UIZ26064.1 hypothetical protein KXD40_001578 [Peronospora effusa]CAI5703743.1 unnamed protein product [Peronospora effusa]
MRVLSDLTVPPVGLDTSAKPKEVAPFLRSLRRMLENESVDILRWTPNGRAFEILDMDRMMDEVLPKYFKHRKYASFQRQLNYFSFKKWTKSKAVICTFSNDCFLRDRPDLSWHIARKKSVHMTMPRKLRPSSMSSVPKRDVELEPMKLEPPRPQPFPSKSSWKGAIVISVPQVPSAMHVGGSYGTGHPIPSPTDMDMMLMENDIEPQRLLQSASFFTTPPLGDQDVDSLEWIDSFLPSLDTFPRQEEPVFAGNTVNVSVSALMRPTPQYLVSSGGDYSCPTSL